MELLVSLIVVLTICAIVWWVVTQLPLPPPMRMVAAVIVGLVAIVMLLRFVPIGHALG